MEDLISRRDAIDAVRRLQTYKLSEGDDMLLVDKAEVQTELMMLPSAQLHEWAQKVEQKQSEALSNPHIKKPLAWALYEVWKEVDKNG